MGNHLGRRGGRRLLLLLLFFLLRGGSASHSDGGGSVPGGGRAAPRGTMAAPRRLRTPTPSGSADGRPWTRCLRARAAPAPRMRPLLPQHRPARPPGPARGAAQRGGVGATGERRERDAVFGWKAWVWVENAGLGVGIWLGDGGGCGAGSLPASGICQRPAVRRQPPPHRPRKRQRFAVKFRWETRGLVLVSGLPGRWRAHQAAASLNHDSQGSVSKI